MSNIENKDIETVETEAIETEVVESVEDTVEVEVDEAPAEEVVAEESSEDADLVVVSENSDEEDEDEEDEDEEEVEESMPTTKAGILNAAVDMLKKANAEEAKKIYASMVRKESVEVVSEEVFKDIESVIEDDSALSEGFKAKAAEIFKGELAEEVARVEAESALQLEEEVASFKTELTEKVDSYLSYVVESWVQDNELEIESGLRTEIAEDFMTSLHSVFKEHYISVPESKVDMVEELTSHVSELEEQLNKTTEENVSLYNSVQASERAEVIRSMSEGLATTEAEKLATLLEDVDFLNVESFEMKAEIVKESFFGAESSVSSQSAELISEDVEDTVVTSPQMARYISAISKSK